MNISLWDIPAQETGGAGARLSTVTVDVRNADGMVHPVQLQAGRTGREYANVILSRGKGARVVAVSIHEAWTEGETERDVLDRALGIQDTRQSPDDTHFCSHCKEPTVRWGTEIVTKYGNDPQCDASPTDNHNTAIRGK
jgi:hypothetical protein